MDQHQHRFGGLSEVVLDDGKGTLVRREFWVDTPCRFLGPAAMSVCKMIANRIYLTRGGSLREGYGELSTHNSGAGGFEN